MLRHLGWIFGGLVLLICALALVSVLKSPWIEWNIAGGHPDVLGQRVIFNSEMTYIEFENEDVARDHGYLQGELEIGRIIVGINSAREMKDFYKGGNLPILEQGTVYVVDRTYWRRHNWLHRSFNGDGLYAILRDPDGTLSIVSFYQFSNSDQAHLAELKYIYEEME